MQQEPTTRVFQNTVGWAEGGSGGDGVRGQMLRGGGRVLMQSKGSRAKGGGAGRVLAPHPDSPPPPLNLPEAAARRPPSPGAEASVEATSILPSRSITAAAVAAMMASSGAPGTEVESISAKRERKAARTPAPEAAEVSTYTWPRDVAHARASDSATTRLPISVCGARGAGRRGGGGV